MSANTFSYQRDRLFLLGFASCLFLHSFQRQNSGWIIGSVIICHVYASERLQHLEYQNKKEGTCWHETFTFLNSYNKDVQSLTSGPPREMLQGGTIVVLCHDAPKVVKNFLIIRVQFPPNLHVNSST